jgi:hypothetical protein
MADVRITFSPDRAAAAERLREAVSAAGYPVALACISDVEELIESEDRHEAATVLVWSRSLVLSALRAGVLRQLRQQRKLIEVSPDGVGPDGGEGDSHVILISGWRGQPFHPGWQRLAGELGRLCGVPTDASEAPVQSEKAEIPVPLVPAALVPPPPRSVPAESTGRKWRPPVGRAAVTLLAAIGLFGAGFATSTWLRTASETQQQSAAEMNTDLPKSAPPAAARAVPPTSAMVAPSAPPTPSGLTPAEPATSEPLPPAAAPSSADRDGPKVQRKKKKESETRSAKNNEPVRGATKRYSRRNSEVMRLFCEGTGRSTPQCRTFLRETRGSRR